MDEAQAVIKNARRNISNLRYADDTTLMTESEEELKNLLKVHPKDQSCVFIGELDSKESLVPKN